MIKKIKVQGFFLLFFLVVFVIQGCTLSGNGTTKATSVTSTPDEIPTWTPRHGEVFAQPTTTEPASVIDAQTPTRVVTDTPRPSPTPKVVTISIEGGTLNIRRGPSTAYNPIYYFNDGETATVVGRDRISRWVLIEVPSAPDASGWVTTETEYTTVKGDVPSLPFVTEEPADPAYIRNCTKHLMIVMPVEVQLLSKFNEPYNEERFDPGIYQVYDLEGPGSHYETVDLREGLTVDILFDAYGEKSKCY